jgi:hypothetical protein
VKRALAMLPCDRLGRDLEEEVRAHLDLLAAEYERQGMAPVDAMVALKTE